MHHFPHSCYVKVTFTLKIWCKVVSKKMFLKILLNSQENICAKVSFLIKFFKKETLLQMVSCEFCENFKNTFFIEHLWWRNRDIFEILPRMLTGNFIVWLSCFKTQDLRNLWYEVWRNRARYGNCCVNITSCYT